MSQLERVVRLQIPTSPEAPTPILLDPEWKRRPFAGIAGDFPFLISVQAGWKLERS
jgi:hypothetical protein